MDHALSFIFSCVLFTVTYRGGVEWFNLPAPEIPKALQYRAKINPIVKTVKNS